MTRTYYFSQKQLDTIDSINARKGRNTPINKVKCDDGVFRRFTEQSTCEEAPNFPDVIVVHKGDRATVSYNGHETIEK